MSGSVTLIYLDTNVYARPFDDQTNETIAAEANAFLEIVQAVKSGDVALLSSDIMLFELHNVLSASKRTKIVTYLELCRDHIRNSDEILSLGRQFEAQCHIHGRDALHVASAAVGNCRYFLSCDRKVTQKKQVSCYRRLVRPVRDLYFSAMNPVRFVEKLKKGELE